MNTYIIVYPIPTKLKKLIKINEDDKVIVVDKAFIDYSKLNLKIDLVIGDFDSIPSYKSLLKEYETIKFSSLKDYSDTYLAVKYAKEKGFNNIQIIGGLGGSRVDHTYANLLILNKYNDVTILNNETKIRYLKKGVHLITFKGYISLFADDSAIITLNGFKYDLKDFKLKKDNPIGLSNELINSQGEIIIKKGSIYLIETNYDK